MLSSLISQMLYEPPKKKVTLRNPICPRCKERPRSIAALSGKVADYCIECKRASYQATKVKKGLK
jgi:tRNA(Ile2) C34 agmatinyltransferase TiaS